MKKNALTARLVLAGKKVGTEDVLSKTYAVYTTGSVVPQLVRLGIKDFGEAERVAHATGKEAVIIESKTVLRVARTMTPLNS